MLPLLQYLAVISAACFGVLLARSKGMDLVGVVCVASIVAFGAGTLRDLLLDRSPLYWVADDRYAWTVLGIAIFGSLLPRVPSRLDRWLLLPDALSLGFYSVVGAGIALQQGTSSLIATIFGLITGTFGGVIGDIVCNEVPNLFRSDIPLYATCSFLGCWIYVGGLQLGIEPAIAQWTAVTFIIALRLLALRFDWSLPSPKS